MNLDYMTKNWTLVSTSLQYRRNYLETIVEQGAFPSEQEHLPRLMKQETCNSFD